MISIIVAIAEGGVIGGGNQLPWHIAEDLKRFKAITTGHPVIMGRKTWESLGRPLPGRRNVVVSRDPAYTADGAQTAGSLADAVALFSAEEEVFVIGGGEIYRQAMDIADRLYITYVDAPFEGDTFFPEIAPAVWRQTACEYHERGASFPAPFRFVDYERIGGTLPE